MCRNRKKEEQYCETEVKKVDRVTVMREWNQYLKWCDEHNLPPQSGKVLQEYVKERR